MASHCIFYRPANTYVNAEQSVDGHIAPRPEYGRWLTIILWESEYNWRERDTCPCRLPPVLYFQMVAAVRVVAEGIVMTVQCGVETE